ncbi:MAG: hypothetical protein GXO86_01845 [Chlorobi bacterium]|nr:hypothetical protein [Chlorobiota bacterium]
MNKKYWLKIAAVIMVLAGVIRAIGGIALLLKGDRLDIEMTITASDLQIIIVAIGLLIIGILFVYAAINLLRDYSKKSWNICWIILLLFILSGLLNGFLLFGQPLDQGLKINFAIVIIIGVLLYLGKPALLPESETNIADDQNEK